MNKVCVGSVVAFLSSASLAAPAEHCGGGSYANSCVGGTIYVTFMPSNINGGTVDIEGNNIGSSGGARQTSRFACRQMP